MQIKPTYESLEKQVAELKKQVETLQSSAVISEHKQTEALLEESERKYRQLFTEMVSGAALYEIICDENGKPVDFVTLEINRAFESLLGVRREELIGKKFSEISSAENTAVWIEMFGKVALTGESTTYEQYASGNNQYFEGAVYSPQHGQFAVTFNDVTERIRGEEKIKEQAELLEKSREQYILAVKGSQDGIWDWDIQESRVFLSPRWKEILGYEDHELPSEMDTIRNGLHPDDKERVKDYLDQYLEGRIPDYSIEYRFRHKNGSYRWIHSRGEALRDENGQPYRMAGAHSDITDRKHNEEYNRMLAEMLDTAPSAITINDYEGRILYANRKTFEIHGYEKNELMALNLYRLNAPESEIFVQGQMKSIGEKGETTFNATHIRKDGTLFPMEVFAKKVVWDNEQAILSIATDITDRVRSEKVLKEFQSNLTALIDHSEDAITLRDAEGKMITCSKAYEKNLKLILGVDAKPGIRTLDYLPEEVRNENEKIIAKVLAGEKHRRESHWEAEGKEYYFESSLNPVKVDNQIIGTVEISRDITDRVIYEKRIREMAERMDLATRAAHIGIWDWDLQKNEVIWNEEMYTLYGINRDSISNIYDAWINSLYPDDRPAHDKLVLQVIRGEIEYDTEFRVVLPDGAIRHIKAFGQVLWDADGKPLRMTGINSDITERKKMEARIQQSQKLEAIGNLAGGIAHDFNNILFPIVGMAELLMDDLPQGSAEYESAEEILKAGKRGSDLVKQILAFSRQSEHKMIPVRAQKILREVLKLIRATIPSYIEIHEHIQEDCGMILADPTQIHQVAMNIITNAYHALESKGGDITVRLNEIDSWDDCLIEDFVPKDRFIFLSISDTGQGIPPHLLDKIYEPYFTTKEQGKGTGLGLAVVYGIIKEHKGEIKVYSEMGKGTCFNIYLPLMPKGEEVLKNKKTKMLPTGSNEHILLVDDEAPIVHLVKQMLERLGYQVTPFTSSIEAISAFKATPASFDLVVSDMAMPNMTGDQFAGELISIRPDIPIIICTGFSERINKEKAAGYGVKGFLLKPIVKSEMAFMVRSVLDGVKVES